MAGREVRLPRASESGVHRAARASFFLPLTQGRFSKRKWERLGSRKLGAVVERALGILAPGPSPFVLALGAELRAWFSAKAASSPLFHTLRKQQPSWFPTPSRRWLRGAWALGKQRLLRGLPGLEGKQ